MTTMTTTKVDSRMTQKRSRISAPTPSRRRRTVAWQTQVVGLLRYLAVDTSIQQGFDRLGRRAGQDMVTVAFPCDPTIVEALGKAAQQDGPDAVPLWTFPAWAIDGLVQSLAALPRAAGPEAAAIAVQRSWLAVQEVETDIDQAQRGAVVLMRGPQFGEKQ
jgi:hypothetical protein